MRPSSGSHTLLTSVLLNLGIVAISSTVRGRYYLHYKDLGASEKSRIMTSDVAQLAECLPSMHEVLGSIPSMISLCHGSTRL